MNGISFLWKDHVRRYAYVFEKVIADGTLIR